MTEVICQSPLNAGQMSFMRPNLPLRTSMPSAGGSTLQRALPRLEILSPVNQNGSFDFDRVLKTGEVSKRSRKTKQWKRFHLVLRANLLSIYKNPSEERLHKQITLSDLTAVAMLKDPKGRRNHLFGLFTPSRDYHFQADSAAEARSWVDLISREARIDEDEDVLISSSPVTEMPSKYSSTIRNLRRDTEPLEEEEHQSSSDPEAFEYKTTRDGIRIPVIRQTSFQENEYSGNENGFHSDFSDAATPRSYRASSSALSKTRSYSRSPPNTAEMSSSPVATRPIATRSNSSLSAKKTVDDEERVIWCGHLLALRSKGGVRQWRKLWVVVRPKHVALYKNEEEYSAHLIIPMFNVISAVEIDPLSRSKAHCLQIIAEERSYRFCARNEETLSRCLGALKSQLARRKERQGFGRPARMT